MNPWELALRRYRKNMIYQWKTAGTVLDWTVVLYMVVPALLLGGKFYYDWWTKPISVPELIMKLNLWYYLFLLPFFTARLRTWQEAADILFLRQLPNWWQTFIRFGILEMITRQAVMMLLLAGLALPWLLRAMGIAGSDIIYLLLLAWLLSCVHALIQNLIQVCFIGWKMRILSLLAGVFVILLYRYVLVPISVGLISTIIGAIFMLGVLLPLCRWRLLVRYAFDRDIDLELGSKLELTNLLLAQAVEKTPKRRRGKRPLLFSHSGYFMPLKTNGAQLGALAVKTLWRSGVHMKFYLTLISAGTAAVMVSSNRAIELLMVVIPALGAILGYWLNGYWREVLESDTWNMYIYDSTDLYQAAAHFVRVNMVIPMALWSLIAALWMPSWVSGLLLFVGCAAGLFIIGVLVMMTRGWKTKETIEMG